MGIIDIFSKRMRRREFAGKVEPYKYDSLPQQLRTQVVHIWRTAIGPGYWRAPSYVLPRAPPLANEVWEAMHDALAREYGRRSLGKATSGLSPAERCCAHLEESGTEEALDIIELSFRMIDSLVRQNYGARKNAREVTQTPDDAIEELNARFQEHAVGYAYINGDLLRTDSQYAHAEVVVPALTLLRAAGFEGAETEFRAAHAHFRHGRIKESLVDALKALESTMKTICARRKWDVDPRANASQLINVVFTQALLPEFLRTHFSGVKQALEAGVPTVRNKLGGHGQGEKVLEVPAYFAAHILHLTAANILLLVEAEQNLS